MTTQSPTRRRRGPNLWAVLLGAVAALVALVTLLGLAPLPVVPNEFNLTLAQVSTLNIRFVTIVGAFAALLGAFNLIRVHVRKLSSRTRGSFYSAITLLGFVGVIVVHVLDRAGVLRVAQPDPANPIPLVSLIVLDTVQVTIESALGGLLFFTLVYAAYRMLRRNVSFWNMLFIAALLVVLIGYIPLTYLNFLVPIRDWLLQVPVSAGTRGLLLGVAIGSVAVGVRVLLGQDRSFRE